MKPHQKMRGILFIIFFYALPGMTIAHNRSEVMLVYRDLISTRGLDETTAPRLQIENVQEKIAMYSKRTNTITIEQSAIDICAGFGKQRKAALAFILGHELEHFFQHPPYVSNFAQAQKGLSNRYREEQADIYGLINSWMAGYNALEISQEVIERLYEDYRLNERKLEDYPRLADRLKGHRKAVQEAKKLLAIYKAAAYLSINNEPFMAARLYDHLKTKYRTPALLNNTALNYMLEVQQFDKETPAFILPFEWDWDSRLKLIAQYDGEKAIGESSYFKKVYSLERAQENLQALKDLKPDYPGLGLHLACLWFLKGDYSSLLQLATTYPKYDPNLELLVGLTYLQQGKRSKGISKLEQLISSEDQRIALMARKNLDILSGNWEKQNVQPSLTEISLPPSPPVTTQPINLGEWQLFVSMHDETGNAWISLVSTREVKKIHISKQRRPCGTMFNERQYQVDIEEATTNGSIVRIKNGELFRLSEDRKIVEICLIK